MKINLFGASPAKNLSIFYFVSVFLLLLFKGSPDSFVALRVENLFTVSRLSFSIPV